MARTRYLKPEFFSDEDLCSLSFQARLCFAGMWCYSDKSGRLEDRPKYLKAMIFPYDNLDIEKLIQSLTSPKPFINRYEVGGKRFIEIINWKKHQNPHHTERNSTFPPAPPLNKEKDKDKGASPPAPLFDGEVTVKEPLNKNNGKKPYGEFKNILLTDEEKDHVTIEEISKLSTYIASKGKKYSSHYATILNWRKREEPAKANRWK